MPTGNLPRVTPEERFALDAAGLGDRPARVFDAAGAGTALIVDVTPGEKLDVWAAARAAVGESGRWPVLVRRDDEDDLFSRFYFEEGADGADSDPAAVLARAETIDVDDRIARMHARYLAAADALPDYARSVTLARYGEAPPLAQIRAAAVDAASVDLAVERHLYDWEHGREPVTEPDQGVQEWFGEDDDVMLALLPSPHPWAVFAYVDALYDTCGYGQDLLTAAARRWYERHGAEPVAALGVMTWFAVTRPPTSPDEAWNAAAEHYALAENTFSTPGISVREHARTLSGADRWVLFSRP